MSHYRQKKLVTIKSLLRGMKAMTGQISGGKPICQSELLNYFTVCKLKSFIGVVSCVSSGDYNCLAFPLGK